jgi:hypothetical protein
MRVELTRRPAVLAALLVAATACLAAMAFATQAEAITEGAPVVEYSAGPANTQAGGHPDVTFQFKVGTKNAPQNPTGSSHANSLKEALVQTPQGFIGNPTAVPPCSTAYFALDKCSADSQVGVVKPYVELQESCVPAPESCDGLQPGILPLYNLTPAPDQAALTGFKAPLFGYNTYTVLSARTNSDYGLDAKVTGIAQLAPLRKFIEYLWGVPAAPVNDGLRCGLLMFGICFESGVPSTSPEVPFLTSPTVCTGPLESQFTTTGFDNVEHYASAPWPAVTGCDLLGFDPSLSALPSTSEADTASGVDTKLEVPQPVSPVAPSDSEIKAVKVKFPEGFSINPNAADGKVACGDAEAKFGTTVAAECPQFAKIGTLTLLSSALPDAIPGSIYIGEPKPGDRYRIIATADGFGTHIKLPGSTRLDPQTGRLTVVFENLPQSPLTEFNMHFFGSERGLFATPTRCGTYPVETEFTPWDDVLPNQESTQFFQVTSGPGGSACPGEQRHFEPTLRTVGQGNGAGLHSPFSVLVKRPDGDQYLEGLTMTAPPGFSATLKGIPYCPETALARAASNSGVVEVSSPSCSPASQVGTSTTGSGAGTHPLYSTGKVYLAGPYKGAPLSLAVITPALSGPYDLGSVVVRAALFVDQETAQVTAVSDPLPKILDGIPLRLRSIQVDLDRDGFTLNPTSCEPFQVTGTISGVEGGIVRPTNHFQVGNCGALDYAPKLSLRLSGGLGRLGHPAIHAVLDTGPNEANTSRVSVALPPGELLDNDHIGDVCTRVQFAADQCPAASELGTAQAETPLLDEPLKGKVYLRSSPEGGLPNLAVDLRGQIDIVLVGKIDTIKGGSLRTTFASVPDAPVSEFTLDLAGGKKGLLQNSKPICGRKLRAKVRMVGHNSARHNTNPLLLTNCGKGQKTKKAKKTKRGNRR